MDDCKFFQESNFTAVAMQGVHFVLHLILPTPPSCNWKDWSTLLGSGNQSCFLLFIVPVT